MANKEHLRIVVEESLDKESITDRVDCGDVNLVELLLDGLPVGLELLLPRRPVFLLSVDIVLKDCVLMREHALNVSQDVVDFTTGLLLNSGTD